MSSTSNAIEHRSVWQRLAGAGAIDGSHMTTALRTPRDLLKAAVNGTLGLVGLKLSRKQGLSVEDAVLRQILEQHEISVVFDVGANVGQYALRLRRICYRGHIVSFEPQAAAYATLANRASRDPQWEAIHLAVGDHRGEAALNVSANSVCSSFLQVLPRIREVEAGFAQTATERVQVDVLDLIYRRFSSASDAMLLKIDAQGYEPWVLAGARELLSACAIVQLEMALFPSYSGQKLLPELIGMMSDLGFALVHLERGFCDNCSGYLLEVDGLFARRTGLTSAFVDRS
jgi:FkbM family methyltransferase